MQTLALTSEERKNYWLANSCQPQEMSFPHPRKIGPVRIGQMTKVDSRAQGNASWAGFPANRRFMARPVATGHNVYFEKAWREKTILDADMSRSDIVAVLERLRFRNGLLTIKIDRDARDYIVRALRER